MNLNILNETLDIAEGLDGSVPKENLEQIYKVLNDKAKAMGFRVVVDTDNKKYIINNHSDYTHFLEFNPNKTENHLVYEVRTETGDIKFKQEYSILDAITMETSLNVIELDMESFE